MKNASKNKQMFNFTIDEKLKTDFIELANNKSINRSRLLSSLIRQWVEENKDLI